MKLKKIFPWLEDKNISDREVYGLSDDNHFLQRGDIFFIRNIKTFTPSSLKFKIKKRPSVVICRAKEKKEVLIFFKKIPVLPLDNAEEEFKRLINLFYPLPEIKPILVGITGTNGKTTVSYFIYQLLKKLGKTVSLTGTVSYLLDGGKFPAPLTTAGSCALRRIIHNSKSEYFVMEVSSHGIKQQRIKDLVFSLCIFTNLSRDHLDYHRTMKDYFSTKRSFFLNNLGAGHIINIDCPYGRQLLNLSKRSLTYAIKRGADIRAKNIVFGKKGTSLEFNCCGFKKDIILPFFGEHNIYNFLAAAGGLHFLGFSLSEILYYSKYLKLPPGRLQEVKKDIFVDYAHTPSALEVAFLALKRKGYKNIISVFGCGGNRDKGKRPLMGRISSHYATFTIITSDNPRREDPSSIARDIASGFSKNNYQIILNRKEAIEAAIKLTKKYRKGCLLVAGKGHEEYQLIGEEKIPFKDAAVIKKILKNNV